MPSTGTKFTDSKPFVITLTGLALFAMYFGAGNLIFPVMIGLRSGTNVTPAVLGFLVTGVALPVLGMVAAATASDGITSIANRIARIPGLIFTVLIFLSTGMMYAIPRVATVSFEMSTKPLLPQDTAGNTPYEGLYLFIYTAVFFALTLILVVNPKTLLDRIGGWLTPALLGLLIVLIVTALSRLPRILAEPAREYATTPLPTGVVQGYFTMDAIASLVFGVIIIASLRARGFNTKQQIFTGTALAGLVAGILLAIMYLGLAAIGTRVADTSISNGAQALAQVATVLFGTWGQLLFGLIALLACLTTAAGLIGASTQYFLSLFPSVSRRTMIAIHLLVSLSLANLGLEMILRVVEPINLLLYPVAICIIFVSLLDIAVPGRLYWTYRLSAWAAAFVAFFEALNSIPKDSIALLEKILHLLPGGDIQMAWLIPAAVAATGGFLLDVVTGRLKSLPDPS